MGRRPARAPSCRPSRATARRPAATPTSRSRLRRPATAAARLRARLGARLRLRLRLRLRPRLRRRLGWPRRRRGATPTAAGAAAGASAAGAAAGASAAVLLGAARRRAWRRVGAALSHRGAADDQHQGGEHRPSEHNLGPSLFHPAPSRRRVGSVKTPSKLAKPPRTDVTLLAGFEICNREPSVRKRSCTVMGRAERSRPSRSAILAYFIGRCAASFTPACGSEPARGGGLSAGRPPGRSGQASIAPTRPRIRPAGGEAFAPHEAPGTVTRASEWVVARQPPPR